jgi:GDSL-like Lipase/Acylhydrolase family
MRFIMALPLACSLILGGGVSPAIALGGQSASTNHLDSDGSMELSVVSSVGGQSPAPLAVVDLGAYPGPSHETWTSVNDSGQVGGDVGTTYQNSKAARWQNGKVTTVGSGGGFVHAIDEAGNLFGAHFDGSALLPARWDANGEHIDGSQSGGEDGGYRDASPNGTALGRQENGGCGTCGDFVAAPPSYHNKFVPGVEGGSVNDLGHVAGSASSQGHGVFYNGSTVVATHVALGYAHALNNHDDIVGNLESGTTQTTAALWHGGITTRLPDLKSAPAGDAHPEAINDFRLIVGRSDSAGAVIWEDGEIKTLDSLLPKASPWHLTEAFAVSNTGYILGHGTFKGETHFFLTQVKSYVKLSGNLWITDCTDRSCVRADAVNDKVQARSTGANPVMVTATSGKGGAWSMNVPRGNYMVTPPAGFVPESKTVAAIGPLAGIDFAVCGSLVESSSTSGLTAAGPAAGTRHVPSGEKGCPDAVDWQTERTGQVPGIASHTPLGMLRQKDIYAHYDVHLNLTLQGSSITKCAQGSVWQWSVTSKPAGSHVLYGPVSPNCDSFMIVDKQGTYIVTATRSEKGNLRQKLTTKAGVHDLLIVAMGDSNGSGEGYPPFWFDQCNRGSASYQYQAAQLLEKQGKRHTSVTFVSASCSGAVIRNLYNQNYVGIRPGMPLQPQIKQIEKAIAPPAGRQQRPVDAAIISAGVNDISFGPILQYCIGYVVHTVPCHDSTVRVVRDSTGAIKDFVHDTKAKQTLGNVIDDLERQLPDHYAELAKAVSASKLVAESQVYLSQYPAFFYGPSGKLCTFFGSGVSTLRESTWRWLAGEADGLNAAVIRAARAHRWNLVQVPARLFWGHGYCSSDPWFVPITYALANWNKAGSFHPTQRGAHVTGVQTLKSLCPLLNEAKACKSFPAP